MQLQDPSTITLGGVQMRQANPGSNLNLSTAPLVGAIYLPDEYSAGAGRVIGMGIEVVNTTSDLNRQGQVTVYRNNQSHGENSSYLFNPASGGTEGHPSVTFSCDTVRSQPLSQEAAMLIPGSMQWKAQEGCYLVVPFVGQENPATLVNYTAPVYETGNLTEDTTGTVNTESRYAPNYIVNVAGSTFSYEMPPTRMYPLHQAGAIFTGLSLQTTLTLTVNIYLETFPTPAEAGILVLATPSAGYDPVALELFSTALTELPVGVMAKDNTLGEWFADVVSTVAGWVQPIASAMGMDSISAGAGVAKKIADGYLRPQSPANKPGKAPVVKQKPKPKPKPASTARQKQAGKAKNARS